MTLKCNATCNRVIYVIAHVREIHVIAIIIEALNLITRTSKGRMTCRYKNVKCGGVCIFYAMELFFSHRMTHTNEY